MNSESHLSATGASVFTLFDPYSLYLQLISTPPPMAHFPSGAGLRSPVISLSIISISWLFIKLNNLLASVSGTWLKTSLVNAPPGCISRVQAVNVLINKPFKDKVRSLFEDHFDKNLDQYVDGKINASQQRVLMTKWVREAWSKVGKMKDSITLSFKKCGLSVALDGSENDEVNIEGLPEYQMPSAFLQDN